MKELELMITRLNQLGEAVATQELLRFCGATSWCRVMVADRPFADRAAVHQAADRAFTTLRDNDWLEAFSHHPRIGDIQSLRMKYAGNREWSAGEQSGVAATTEATLNELAAGNGAYEHKFGFIFIVCATGKTASEMLALLNTRLTNDRDTEIKNAAIEQQKITHLRIDKWEIKP